MNQMLDDLKEAVLHLLTPRTSNNHRSRLLHPAGFAVLVAFTLIFNSGIELVKATQPAGLVLGFASNITTEQVFAQTNQERGNLGLKPLKRNPELDQAAHEKALDMFEKNYWAHISPDGTTPWFFIKKHNYRYSIAGENLARDFDTTQPMVKAWMSSPTHKANIVHDKFTDTGVAVVNGKLDGIETTLVVQMFGMPAFASQEITTSSQNPQISSGSKSTVSVDQTTKPTNPQQAVLSHTNTQTQTMVSPANLKRSFTFSIVILMIGILVIDELIIHKKQTLRFVGKNWAHLSFLAVVFLMLITLSKPGGIL